jgi:hypothetical protein
MNAYNGQASFDGRPKFWNVLGHADKIAWDTVEGPARMAHAYDGTSPTYGYAKVYVPDGVKVGNANVAEIPAGTTATTASAQLGTAKPLA